jgi:hypothetical protein
MLFLWNIRGVVGGAPVPQLRQWPSRIHPPGGKLPLSASGPEEQNQVGSKGRSGRPGAVRGQPVRNRCLKKEPIFRRTEGPSSSLSFRNTTAQSCQGILAAVAIQTTQAIAAVPQNCRICGSLPFGSPSRPNSASPTNNNGYGLSPMVIPRSPRPSTWPNSSVSYFGIETLTDWMPGSRPAGRRASLPRILFR